MINSGLRKKRLPACAALLLALAALLIAAYPAPVDNAHNTMSASAPLLLANRDDVVCALRTGLRQRAASVTISFEDDSDVLTECETLVRGLMEEALSETEDPAEGDYIRYQYGGYTYHCSYDAQVTLPDSPEARTGNTRYRYTIRIVPDYYSYLAWEEQVDERVAALIADFCFDTHTTPCEKIRACYAYVCENVTYDKVHRKNPYYHKCSTAYAALFQKTATCQGYCTALYRLLKEAGICCRIVTGQSGDEALHAWVIAEIDGLYYLLDPTWDAEADGDPRYFLTGCTGDDNHLPDEAFLTEAFQTQYPPAEAPYRGALTDGKETDLLNRKRNVMKKTICCVLLAMVTALSVTSVTVFAQEEEAFYLTWDEYREANGIESWNYNDMAAAIAAVANHACDLYAAGETQEAYEFAKATYWGYYETSGFERNTMNYISSSRVSQVELGFTTLRKAVKKDQGEAAVREAADVLIGYLTEDALILSPEGASVPAEDADTAADEASDDTEWPHMAVLDTCYKTWDEHREAYGVSEWNYNDLAAVIAAVADHACDLYAAGETEEAYEFAKATYWGYYETSGFERNTMNYISSSRVSEVELCFTTLRKAVKKDQGEAAVREAAEALTSRLFEDGMILSPDGPLVYGTAASADMETGDTTGAATDTDTSAGTGTGNASSVGSAVAIFLGSFGIILREGLEAILIVGAIIAYLVKTGNEKGVRHVYVGSVLGVVCSFIMAGILNYLLAKSAEYHMSQEIIEGIAALTAVVVLFYVSNWMISKSESATWTKYIKEKAGEGAAGGSMLALVFTAWLAVFREGAEVILFYQPMLREDRPDMVWAGFGTGCAALVVVFLLIRFLSVRLPIGPFFMATSILMALMSISFLGAGIKELMEGGVLDNFEVALSSPSWLSWIPYNDTLDVLGIYPLVGTIVPQLILLAITIVTFVMHIRRSRAAKEAAAHGGNASGNTTESPS